MKKLRAIRIKIVLIAHVSKPLVAMELRVEMILNGALFGLLRLPVCHGRK
jgi:hypothetical protein